MEEYINLYFNIYITNSILSFIRILMKLMHYQFPSKLLSMIKESTETFFLIKLNIVETSQISVKVNRNFWNVITNSKIAIKTSKTKSKKGNCKFKVFYFNCDLDVKLISFLFYDFSQIIFKIWKDMKLKSMIPTMNMTILRILQDMD